MLYGWWTVFDHASQIPYNNGVRWPDLVVGVVAALLLSAGLLPPYFELWKRDGRVIGFSKFGFVCVLTEY